MSYLMNNQQKLNDIVFADRNKSYGAYQLRSEYGYSLFKALGITASLAAFIIVFSFFISSRAKDDQSSRVLTDEKIYQIEINKTPDPDPITTTKEELPNSRQHKETSLPNNPVIVDSTQITQKSNTEEPTTVNSSSTLTGSETGGSIGTSTAAVTIPGKTVIRNDIHVDQLPEFEGGLKALYKFIANNIRIPEEALENGKGGKLFVRFVVDEEGKISSATLMNNLGYGLDEEALRVVRMIPKFKTPAIVGGEPVKMYYQLPINFRLN